VRKTPASEGSGFTETLANAMDQVESLRTDAQQQVASLLSGKGGELHSTMIAVEKADVAFQLMMQMRNKIVSAYEEVARMQF
jgi:flagellar hook-basal body complex protein FliE